jgi:zinc protease
MIVAKRTIPSLLVLMMAITAPLSGGFAAQPEITQKTLSNGLEVVVIPDRRAPVVTHIVWYKVGSADEPPGKSGIAHFLEHLMFKGTEKIAPGEFSKIVARNGGQDNAFTSQDATAYFQRVATDRLPLVMEMEADRMTNLRLRPEDVTNEQQVVLEERRSRVDNDPSSILSEQMGATLFLSHSYRIPIIGWVHLWRAAGSELSRLYAARPVEAVRVLWWRKGRGAGANSCVQQKRCRDASKIMTVGFSI